MVEKQLSEEDIILDDIVTGPYKYGFKTEIETETEAQPQVNEGALDSSGISDNSSNADPDTLSVADDFAGDVEIEVEAESNDESVAEETTIAAAETTMEDTATKTVEVIGVFETEIQQNITVMDENSKNVKVATIEIINPSGIFYSVAVTGKDSDQFDYNIKTHELMFTGESDFETTKEYDVNIVYTKDNEEREEVIVPINLKVNDVNEAPVTTFTQEKTQIEENIETGTVVAKVAASDPESGAVNYSLSGRDADKFQVDAEGNVCLLYTSPSPRD